MCIGLAQYKLDYGKSFREVDLKFLKKIELFKDQLLKMNPNNLRINLWKPALIITEDFKIKEANFGWITKKNTGGTWPVFNVRVEGGWNNKENNPNYDGPYQVFSNPYVKDLIYTQRCIIPCDFFIEQPSNKKDKRKFLIQKRNQEPIHLGGVYKEELNEDTGEISRFFSILTNPYNSITHAIGHERSPLLLNNEALIDFLNPELRNEELVKLFMPNNIIALEAYEVDPIIAKVNCPLKDNDLKLRQSIGEVITV